MADIITTFNPPRMIMLADQVYWIRALSQEDFAILIAWIDDVLPKQEDRVLPSKLNDPESQKALDSPMGWSVMAWVALRHSGVSYQTAAKMIWNASEVEKARFTTVLFRKRPTYQPSGEGSDLGEAWWGPSVAALSKENGLSVPQIAAMTLDQVAILATDGLEDEKPTQERKLTIEEVQAMWEANQPRVEPELVTNGDPE